MTNESKTLPPFDRKGATLFLFTGFGGGVPAREEDLSAVLAAMDPERREHLLAPFVTLPNHYASNGETGDGQTVCDVCGGPADEPHRPEECAQQVGLAVDHGWHVAGVTLDEANAHRERAEAAEQALAAERAKVADLEQRCGEQKVQLDYAHAGQIADAEEIAELRATLAKVEAERDGMRTMVQNQAGSIANMAIVDLEMARELKRFRAFFGEFGQSMLDHLIIDQGDDYEGTKALSAILATLPKGTKET